MEKNISYLNIKKNKETTDTDIIKNFLHITKTKNEKKIYFHIYIIHHNNNQAIYKKTFKINNNNNNERVNEEGFLNAFVERLFLNKNLSESVLKYNKSIPESNANENDIKDKTKEINLLSFTLSVIKFFLSVFQVINFLNFYNSHNKNIKNSSIYILPILAQALSIPYFYRPLILVPYMQIKLKLFGEG